LKLREIPISNMTQPVGCGTDHQRIAQDGYTTDDNELRVAFYIKKAIGFFCPYGIWQAFDKLGQLFRSHICVVLLGTEDRSQPLQ